MNEKTCLGNTRRKGPLLKSESGRNVKNLFTSNLQMFILSFNVCLRVMFASKARAYRAKHFQVLHSKVGPQTLDRPVREKHFGLMNI